jgi:hypothetical protein
MATNTWQAALQGATYAAANKHLLDVFNASSSTRYIRIYRAYLFNNQTGAVTGVLNTLKICILSTSVSAGSAVTPVAMDSTNAALNANTTSGTGRTTTIANTIRQIVHSPDEPALNTLDWDSLGTLVPFAELWNTGYGDANIQPVTCRASENRGFSIQNVTQTVGVADLEILFTDAAS